MVVVEIIFHDLELSGESFLMLELNAFLCQGSAVACNSPLSLIEIDVLKL